MGLRPYNWIQYLTLFVVVALGVVLPVFAWEITGLQHNQTTALRTVICTLEGRTLASPILTASQRRQTIDFYDSALNAIHAKVCF